MNSVLHDRTDLELLELQANVIKLLRERGVLRTNSNPTGDYAEYLIAQKLGLTLMVSSNKSYDAIDERTGEKYQIKARRWTKQNGSAQLGIIRNLDTADFSWLIAVILNEDFSVHSIHKVPKSVIKKYARYSEHQKGHILTLRGDCLADPQTEVLASSKD